MVKFNKQEALLRLNADIKELEKLEPNDDKRKQLIQEIDILTKITHDESKDRLKENFVKTACIGGLMCLTYALDRSGVLNKAVMSFVPKHI